MKKLFFLLALFGIAAVHADEPQPFSNRVLFVVETSSTMKRSAETARNTVAQLIESGAQEQLKTGDTFGVWTFNEALDTSFPLQHWNTTDARQLAITTTNFLGKARFEKKGQLGSFWPALRSVVERSKGITVILISSGNDPIHGTPFDSQINIAYANYARDLRDAKACFVTSLIGRNSKMVAYAVNSSFTIQIPKIPPPTPPPKVNLFPENNAVATNAVEPPKRYAKENIIVTATKPTPTNSLSGTNLSTNPETKNQATATNSISSAASNVVPANNVPSTPKIQETVAPILTNQNVEKILSTEVRSNAVETKLVPATNVVTNAVIVTNAVTITNVVQVTNLVPEETQIPLPVSAVATTSDRAGNHFLLIAAGLVLVAIGLIVFVIRTVRRNSKPSLISRSMDK